LLKAGFSLAAVQYRLGHSSSAITGDLYGRIDTGFQDGITDELSKMMNVAEAEKNQLLHYNYIFPPQYLQGPRKPRGPCKYCGAGDRNLTCTPFER
jgi:hypothetical protein